MKQFIRLIVRISRWKYWEIVAVSLYLAVIASLMMYGGYDTFHAWWGVLLMPILIITGFVLVGLLAYCIHTAVTRIVEWAEDKPSERR